MKRTEFSQLTQLAREKQEPEDRINFKGSRVQHRPCVAKAQEESWHGSKESQKEAALRKRLCIVDYACHLYLLP